MKAFLGCAVLFLSLLQVTPASAQEQNWLPPGSETQPSRPIPEWVLGGALEGDALIGRLLFHSPSLLGEKAVRMRISCASCHPSGHLNERFFIPDVSSDPGNVDLTHKFWFEGGEDGDFNPKPIPSLQNSREAKIFGTGPVFGSLEEFSRHVIIDEFGGPEPDGFILEALAAYMGQLTRPETNGAAPLSRPISFKTYLDLAETSPRQLDLIADLLIEEAGRRERFEQKDQYRQIATELKKLRTGSLSEALKLDTISKLRELSKRIP